MRKKTVTSIATATAILFTAVTVFLYFSDCVAIPEQVRVVTGTGAEVRDRFDGGCSGAVRHPAEAGSSSAGLDPADISLLSWNSHKGSHEAFTDDLGILERGVDLVLLQEAVIDRRLKRRLQLSDRKWDMAVAFELENEEAGLLSASGTFSVSVCADRVSEPLLVLPKTILATTYPVAGMTRQLLVVNVHMVNFTLTNEALQQQLGKVTRLVENHVGPVIVAGDFNTWNSRRQTEVGRTMAKLGLQQVLFAPDNRSRFFNRTVDEVYFSGLMPVKSISHTVKTSDHNPLEVHFRIAG